MTAAYMPPQHRKGTTAQTAMLFSLGCLLYRMLVSKQGLPLLTAMHNGWNSSPACLSPELVPFSLHFLPQTARNIFQSSCLCVTGKERTEPLRLAHEALVRTHTCFALQSDSLHGKGNSMLTPLFRRQPMPLAASALMSWALPSWRENTLTWNRSGAWS